MNKKLLIFGLLGLLFLGGGGVGALFALRIVGGGEVEAKVETVPDTTATYIELKPIAAPVIEKNRILFNVLLTLSIEVSGESEKKRVARFTPRLRDAMLRELHQRPIIHDTKTSRFDLDEVKSRMLKIVQDTTGNEAVSDVLVVSAVRVN